MCPLFLLKRHLYIPFMSAIRIFCTLLLLLPLIEACQQDKNASFTHADPAKAVFTRLPSSDTGIDFKNTLVEDGQFDVFRYRNYYNGGGVAIGDVDNDGLADIYLSANCAKNRLYHNQGGLQFEDITEKSGTGGNRSWSTGVTMADVNGDGWLDIYVCNSGNVEGDDQQNELFINQGNLTFIEQAAEYGLADKGFGTHAVFFDFDLDQDLDCYILNNSFRPVSTLGERNVRHIPDEKGGAKMYRNDGGKFVDISRAAGIYSSVIGFGLGITCGDINVDGWPDLYISNDFHERDYLYLNNQKGGFRECLPEYFDQISLSSMGADLADLNNDGLPEIFSTDMLPGNDRRLKQLTTFQNFDTYQKRLQLDYFHQFTSNMLQLHNGFSAAGALLPFSEVGEMAGVEATDWSWGALMADFDNDSRRDLLVCNGIYKDVTDQDFLNFLSNDANMEAAMRGEKVNFQQWISKIPSEKIPNCLFTRTGEELTFKNAAAAWGLGEPSFSNGAAYGDLDNDGDLDLVINNVNQELFFYKNNSRETGKNHSLRVRFKGGGKNTAGVGALLYVFRKGEILSYEHIPMRGFQSSMDYTAVVGLGEDPRIDSLIVWWPGGQRQQLTGVQADTLLSLRMEDGVRGPGPLSYHLMQKKPVFEDQTARTGIEFVHRESAWSDFDQEQLTYSMLSAEGPALAAGDVNGDGREDLYTGGAKGQAGQLFIQGADGHFRSSPQKAFQEDAASEDTDAVFFDADGDGDQDLYVVSGSTEFYDHSALLQDRLYINQQGLFLRKPDALPVETANGACARPFDFDQDGDLDLFVGTRSLTHFYGQPADSYLWENNGRGIFTDVSRAKAGGLRKIGMVTDAVWADADADGVADLVLVGDWMPLTVLKNERTKLNLLPQVSGLQASNGFWKSILAADVDQDGDQDFVCGNIGNNTRFRASAEAPVSLYVSDFDKNGILDQIYTYTQNGKTYPMQLLHDLNKRMPFLKKKFLYYKDYSGKSIEEVLGDNYLKEALRLQVFTTASAIFVQQENGGFTAQTLPQDAQRSCVRAWAWDDFDKDGQKDLFAAGNFYYNKPELGRFGGNYGTVLSGDGKGHFTALPLSALGVYTRAQITHTALIPVKNDRKYLILAQNNTIPAVWTYGKAD